MLLVTAGLKASTEGTFCFIKHGVCLCRGWSSLWNSLLCQACNILKLKRNAPISEIHFCDSVAEGEREKRRMSTLTILEGWGGAMPIYWFKRLPQNSRKTFHHFPLLKILDRRKCYPKMLLETLVYGSSLALTLRLSRIITHLREINFLQLSECEEIGTGISKKKGPLNIYASWQEPCSPSALHWTYQFSLPQIRGLTWHTDSLAIKESSCYQNKLSVHSLAVENEQCYLNESSIQGQ